MGVALGRFAAGGNGGGGENDSRDVSVSYRRICSSEAGCSHGGGTMLARRWRLRSNASHKGIFAR